MSVKMAINNAMDVNFVPLSIAALLLVWSIAPTDSTLLPVDDEITWYSSLTLFTTCKP